MRYFAARAKERAPRTVYDCVLNSLQFLEEAGELPLDQRLSTLPALRNSAKEQAAKRARETEQEGSTTRKQAPPLLLALLAKLEETVNNEALPLYHRAYA